MTILPTDPPFDPTSGGELPTTVDKTHKSTNALGISATQFANALTKAFTDATAGGKKFDDVLKSLALRLSSLTVAAAFKPVAKGLTGGLNNILKGILGGDPTTGGSSGGGGDSGSIGGTIISNAMGAIKPFASGGVIGTPSYFPLLSGGMGLAGEAGPEAIIPLSRGADGSLGVSMNGGGAPANVTVQISTPDAASFRRSEAYLTGQIARAVARGQRSL